MRRGFATKTFTALSFDSASLDYVLVFDVIEHVEDSSTVSGRSFGAFDQEARVC